MLKKAISACSGEDVLLRQAHQQEFYLWHVQHTVATLLSFEGFAADQGEGFLLCSEEVTSVEFYRLDHTVVEWQEIVLTEIGYQFLERRINKGRSE